MDLKPLLIALGLMLGGCATPLPDSPGAPREYAGILVGETRWSGEVVMADDVIIPRGSCLIIEPGTRILVRSTQSTKIEPEQLASATELLVRGRLEALGSSAAPIEFVASAAEDVAVAWAGIIADRGESLLLEHVLVRRAEQGAWLVATPGRIERSVFEGCRYGLVFQGEAEQRVTSNRVLGGEAGIFCWKGARPELTANIVRGQSEEGVFIDALSRPVLRDNLIAGNGIGLVAADVTPFGENEIRDNAVDFLPLGGR